MLRILCLLATLCLYVSAQPLPSPVILDAAEVSSPGYHDAVKTQVVSFIRTELEKYNLTRVAEVLAFSPPELHIVSNMDIRLNEKTIKTLRTNEVEEVSHMKHYHVQFALLLSGRLADQQAYKTLAETQWSLMNQIEIALNDDEWTPELSDSTQAMISFRKNCSHHMQEIRESLGRTIVCLEYRPTRNTARQNIMDIVTHADPARDRFLLGALAVGDTNASDPVVGHGLFLKPYTLVQERSPEDTLLNHTKSLADELGRVLARFYESLAEDYESVLPEEAVVHNEQSMTEFIAGVKESGRLQTQLRQLRDGQTIAQRDVALAIAHAGDSERVSYEHLSELQHRAAIATAKVQILEARLTNHTTMLSQLGTFDLVRFTFKPSSSPSTTSKAPPVASSASSSHYIPPIINETPVFTPASLRFEPAAPTTESLEQDNVIDGAEGSYDSDLEEESRQGETIDESDQDEDWPRESDQEEEPRQGEDSDSDSDDSEDDDAVAVQSDGSNLTPEIAPRSESHMHEQENENAEEEEMAAVEVEVSAIVSEVDESRAVGGKSGARQGGGDEPVSQKRRLNDH